MTAELFKKRIFHETDCRKWMRAAAEEGVEGSGNCSDVPAATPGGNGVNCSTRSLEGSAVFLSSIDLPSHLVDLVVVLV